MSVPAAPLSRKFDSVAPVKVPLRKRLRSMKALIRWVSIWRNHRPHTTVTTMRPSPIGLIQPMFGPCEM